MDKQGSIDADTIVNAGDNKISQQNFITINNYVSPSPPKLSSPRTISTNPYKGLAHFGPADAEFFFGRDELIKTLLQTVSKNTFTAIIGPSGSGKSSVVLAGVAPQLAKEGEWLFSYFRVSDSTIKDPFQAMMQALIPFYYVKELDDCDPHVQAKRTAENLQSGELTLFDINDRIRKNFPQKRLLLIVDQFEELFTTGVAEEAQKKFISLLVEVGQFTPTNNERPNLSIVLTMRADFLERAASYATFATLIDRCSHIIGPMEPDQLREAIQKPASRQGVEFEAGLIDTILDDAGTGQGNLPLVEFALSLLWERQENNQITSGAYDDLGRIKGALTKHAQTIYDSLSSSEQIRAQRIFTQLVKIGNGVEDTRRIAYKSDFHPEDWQLLQRFANESYRLVVTNKRDDEETAEVVHEALIQHWSLLKKWVQEDRLFLSWLDTLRQAKEQWQIHAKDDGSLLRGVALQQALEWQKSKIDQISKQQQDFIYQSLRHNEQEFRKKQRWIRFGALAAIITITILSFMGLSLRISLEAANKQKTEANKQRDKQLITQSRFLADLSTQENTRGNYRLSILYALEALPDYTKPVNQLRPLVSEAFLALSLNRNMYFDMFWFSHEEARIADIKFSSDGSILLTTDEDGLTRLWNEKTGNEIASRKIEDGTFYDISADSKRFLTAQGDVAKLWDIESEEFISLSGHEGKISNAVFSPDGKRILTFAEDGNARLWHGETGALIATLPNHGSAVIDQEAFSLDNKRIATASTNEIFVWSSETGESIAKISSPQGVDRIIFSPDNVRVLTAIGHLNLNVWNRETGDKLSFLNHRVEFIEDGIEHRGLYKIDFSPDGNSVLVFLNLEDPLVWDLETDSELYHLEGHADRVDGNFSPDGNQIITLSFGEVHLWNAKFHDQIDELNITHVYKALFSPDSQMVLAISELHNGKATFWSAVPDPFRSSIINYYAELDLPSGRTNVSNAVFSSNGAQIAVVFHDGSVHVINTESGDTVRTLGAFHGSLSDVIFNPNTGSIVTLGIDGLAHLWRVPTLYLPDFLSAIDSRVNFSPKGEHVVTWTDFANDAQLWDADSRSLKAPLKTHSSISDVIFSPDESRFVTVSNEEVQLWDSNSGSLIESFKGNKPVFSPDGKRLLLQNEYGYGRVWESQTGKHIASLNAGYDYAAFNWNGERIITAPKKGTAQIWNGSTGAKINPLKGPEMDFNHVAYSHLGELIVTASNTGAQLWDGKTGSLVHPLVPNSGEVKYAEFSFDDKRISTSSAGTTKHWSVETGFPIKGDGGPESEQLILVTEESASLIDGKNWLIETLSPNLVEQYKALNLSPLTTEERERAFLD